MVFSANTTGDEVVKTFASEVKGKTCELTPLLPFTPRI